jgi:hypothetical protein
MLELPTNKMPRCGGGLDSSAASNLAIVSAQRSALQGDFGDSTFWAQAIPAVSETNSKTLNFLTI